jgi:hypothetical protein
MVEMERCKVNFFFYESDKKKIKFKSLMGPMRHRVLRNFKLKNIIADPQVAKSMQVIWDDFAVIYDTMNVYDNPVTSEQFRTLVTNWVKYSFEGSSDIGNSELWKLAKKEITPYVHCLMCHFCYFLPILKRSSCQNMERQNNLDGRQFFQCNSRNKENALTEMLLFKYRKLVNPEMATVLIARGDNQCAYCRRRFMYESGCMKHQDTCYQNPDHTTKLPTQHKEYKILLNDPIVL